MTSAKLAELARALAAGVPGARPPTNAALEPMVAKAIDRARAAWPDLAVDLGAFIAHVAATIDLGAGDASAERWDATLSGLAIEDLYLAFACGGGDDAALRAFERDMAGELQAAFDKLRLPP